MDTSSGTETSAPTYGTMTDKRDGQTYYTVVIGTQTWMAENLNYAVDSSWCYENKTENCTAYGRLYQWAAAMKLAPEYNDILWGLSDADHQGVCSAGWHMPNNAEWQTLFDFVDANNGDEGVGRSLKSTVGWETGKFISVGTNRFGFSALPVGQRLYGKYGELFDFPYEASFWSSSQQTGRYSYAYHWVLGNSLGDGDTFYCDGEIRTIAISVRCLKND
ncbi:MAG: fibrobacter succinogenes major paralogous domain-containing protein [Fibrobacteraceae bacterium]